MLPFLPDGEAGVWTRLQHGGDFRARQVRQQQHVDLHDAGLALPKLRLLLHGMPRAPKRLAADTWQGHSRWKLCPSM